MNSGSKRNELYQPKSTQYYDDSEVVSVVQILTQNIVQWSFVESQLSEPQVNVNIPEIAIPLKHLSSSLVLLGSVLYSRNDLYESKIVYERACPLVELTIKVDKSEIDDCFNKLVAIYQNMYNQGGVSADNGSEGVSVDENDAASSNSMSYKRKNRKRNHILNFDETEEEDKTAPHSSIMGGNQQNNDTETHNASIQKSSLYSLLSEINIYDTFEIENQYTQTGGLFNVTLRIDELKSQYEHVRRTLQRSTASNSPQPQPTSTPYESKQHEYMEIEAFWDLQSIRNHVNYNREQSKQMFLNINLLIHNYIHGDVDDQNVLLRSVSAIAQQSDVHPIYTILATVMTEINNQGSFDDYFEVLEDFFDLTEMKRESFLAALTSIESSSLPVSIETQWKLIVIYMFDKAYIELEQGKVFSYLPHQHDDDSDAFHYNENSETPKAIDFERFADEPNSESDSNNQRNEAVSNDSTSFLLSFLLFVTLLVSIGVYQLLRNRNHSHRQVRSRKSAQKGYNDDDFINQIYSFISNDCKKVSTDSDTSDSDSRLMRQNVVDTHVAFLSRMYDTTSYYLHKLLQGSKHTVENSNVNASLPRVPSKKNKISNKNVKKGSNSSVSNNSGKGKGSSKSTSQPTAHQESGSMNDDLDSDDGNNSDVVSDGEKTQPKAHVVVAADITHIAASIDDDNHPDSEWVHAGKNSKSTKAPPVAPSTSVAPPTVVNPPKLKKESNKAVNKSTLPAPSQPNVTKDLSIIAAPRMTDVSYTAIVKSNSAVALHTSSVSKASQHNEDKFDKRDDSFGEYKAETTKEIPSSTKSVPEDDDESLLMSIHAHIDSSLMNASPDSNGPPGFENNSTGLWGLSSGIGTSTIPTYWNNVPEMDHLDGLFMSNSTKLYPRSDLNLDAPTFIPSTPLNFLMDVNRDLQIIVTVNCISIGDPSFIKSAVIVLLLADKTQTIGMTRSNFKPSLWTARLTLPFHYEGGILTYKYYIEDINNKVWEESEIIHSIDINYACKQGVVDSFVSPICK